MGAVLSERLTAAGDRVIGVDLRNADVEADLGTPAGRASAIEQVTELSGGALDGLVTLAGLAGLPERPASLLISVNYFGTVELLAGLRPLLAKGTDPAAVAISSNSTTCQPGLDEDAHRQLPRGRRGGHARARGRGRVAQHLPGHQDRAQLVGAPSTRRPPSGRAPASP